MTRFWFAERYAEEEEVVVDVVEEELLLLFLGSSGPSFSMILEQTVD